MPAALQESEARSLTGPAAGLSGLFRGFDKLASRGWQMIDAAIAQIEHGSPTAARFARANVALYITSVYDAHFGLAQIGRKLEEGYEQLGGPAAFGTTLAQAEVDRLAQAYSESAARLYPHARVHLGS